MSVSKPLPGTFRIAATLLLLPLLAGCRVVHQNDGKDNENVKIATPFGGMSVKTNDNAVGAVGLSLYPGAVREKKDDHGSDGAADVNLSFGDFHLGVRAASYRTPDAPDKVLAFYRKDMAKYGLVIQCRNNKPVGSPVRTADGLTCDKDDHNMNGSDTQQDELRAGSKQHQHIVGVELKDGATRIGLVQLDLPKGLTDHGSDSEQ